MLYTLEKAVSWSEKTTVGILVCDLRNVCADAGGSGCVVGASSTSRPASVALVVNVVSIS